MRHGCTLRAFGALPRATPAALAVTVHELLCALTAAMPSLGRWRAEDNDGDFLEVPDVVGAEAALRGAAVRWRVGDESRVSYQPAFVGEGATLRLTLGVGPLPFPGLWVPDRAELTLRSSLTAESVGLAVATLGELARGVRASWAHAGGTRAPFAPTIPGDGAVVPGWLTWLGSGWNLSALSLPREAAAYTVGEGTLIAALPGPFRPGDDRHLLAVQRVADALRCAGVRVA